MSDPSIAIQNAIEAELRANAAVKAEFPNGLVKVYTLSAPNPATYPYIIIGEDQILGDDNECASMSEVICTIHVWSRQDTIANSRLKAKAIAGAVRKALTKQLTLTGHVMDDWNFDEIRHLTDTDGLTAHSVLTMSYATTATA